MLQQIMLTMNTWQQRITVTHDADEDSKHVHFLDLWLHLDTEKVHFATYHKPNCLCMYTPFNSCHPLNIKRGIVMTELTRLIAYKQFRGFHQLESRLALSETHGTRISQIFP